MAKKDENAIHVVLTLEAPLKEHLEDLMEDEFQIASKKWGLSLNSEEKQRILHYAMLQLQNKIAFITKKTWKPTDPDLTVIVRTPRKEKTTIVLPDDADKYPEMKVERSHDVWKLNQDPNDNAVLLSDFREHFLQVVDTWARTAVFYGVGSYS